jgi:hypothetical protein
MEQVIDQIIIEVALRHGLNPAVIHAQARVETELNAWAVRYEPTWRYVCDPAPHAKQNGITVATETTLQMISWGLLQIMGAVARELGFTGPIPSLTVPRIGLRYGCLKMQQLIHKYDQLPLALAAYNAGHPGTTAGMAYADKVLARINPPASS